MIERYTYQHLKTITSIFGVYLFVHFVYLIYFAQELFSDAGMFPGKLSPTYGYFPNILNYFNQPPFATLFLSGLTLLSVLVIVGIEKKWLYLALWFGWACLLNRNPLIRNPGMPYVGWMLLVFAVIYPIKNKTEFRLDKWLFWGAWSLLSIGYTLSGLDKLQSISWQNGTAISHLLENPLARDYWITDFLKAQIWLHPLMTYASLTIEILFLPLALWHKTRPWIWLALIGMQTGILFVVDFADLTFGMLMIHLFTFDPRWIPNKVNNGAIIFFDGVCGLCNASVDFLIREDFSTKLQYSPLQGEAVKKHLLLNQKKLNTLYVWTGEKMLSKSAAWLWLLSRLGGLWTLLSIPLRLIPEFILDFIYDLIAKYRYKIFGQRETCRFPTPAERKLFLD